MSNKSKQKRGPARPGRDQIWVKPPAQAKKIAASALEERASLPKSRRGGLDPAEAKRQGVVSGVARAKSIVRGDLQPAFDVRDFFVRFRGIYAASLHKPWSHSKIQQSWDLWGGEPMWLAARAALEKAGYDPGVEPEL